MSSLIGNSVIKPDARDKVTGKAVYCADINRPGLLHAVAYRSEHSHARLISLDVSKAQSMPGVKAVLTGADIPGENRVGMTGVKDTPVLASAEVCFYQQAVAVVAAETLAQARAAVVRIEANWEALPVLNTIEEAMAPGAYCLHEKAGNISCDKLTEYGDVDAALAAADIVIQRTYTTQMAEHAYIEPEAVLAEPYQPEDIDAQQTGVLVWSTTKSVHMDQTEICRVTGLPPELVCVKAPYIGGSFGGKSDLPINCMAALLCLKTGCPVKMVYTREESMQVSTKRHPMIMHYTHGATKDGHLVAVKAEILADSGAYSGYSAPVLTRSVLHGAGPYAVPNVRIHAVAYYTNNPTTGAMRGFGVPQVALAHERQMDLLAAALGMEPMAVRLLNGLKEGDLLPSGQALPGEVGYIQALEEAAIHMKQENTKNPLQENEAWGIAGHYYGNGRTAAANPGTAIVSLQANGRVLVAIGSPDIGQGSNTVMAQITAAALQINISHIDLISADTRHTLDSGTTSGTRLTTIVGRGVRETAVDFLNMLKQQAALLLNVYANEVLLQEKGGQLMAAAGHKQISLQEMHLRCSQTGHKLSCTGKYDPPTTALNAKCQGAPYASYTFGVQCIKVRVQRETGKVYPLKAIAVYDVGTPLNPRLLEGQMEGGIAGGLGYGLWEEVKLKDGRILNHNFDSYLLPTSMDVCPVESYFVPTKDGEGPFGAKGVGEPSLIPTAAALANAVSIILHKECNSLPLDLERVQEAV